MEELRSVLVFLDLFYLFVDLFSSVGIFYLYDS